MNQIFANMFEENDNYNTSGADCYGCYTCNDCYEECGSNCYC